MKRTILLLFPIVLFFAFLNFDAAFAQDSAGVTLEPTTIEDRADPGTVITKTLIVKNESEIDKEFYVYVRNISGVEAGGVPIFAEDGIEKTGYEIADWVSIGSGTVAVPGGGSAEIPVTISVPESATPGSHFGGVFVSMEPPKFRETGASVGYQVVSVISILINGDVIDTARVRSFSTDKLIYSTKNVVFTAKVENQGNILIRPHGLVSITGMFGGDPEVFTVNENLAGVFPGTMRDLTFTWESDGIGFGRYEAVLALVYEGENRGQKTIDATLVFWVFPIKIVLAILAIIITIFALGYVFTRYYINQAIMRAAGGRRIVSPRYRRQVGLSRFAFVFVSILSLIVVFLLVILVLFA